MKKNSELPKIRITSDLFDKMKKCLDDISKQTAIDISMPVFRRMAYDHYVNQILQEGLEIKFVPE